MVNKSKKRKMNVSEESMLELMQETYNDIVDERNKAVIAYKRFSRDIEENTDIALVGKITNELLKIIDGTIDKKLRLIKIQSDILYKNGKTSSPDGIGSMIITDEDKKWAEEYLKRNVKDNNEKEYE